MGQISSWFPNLSPEYLLASRSSHKITAKADLYFGGQYTTTVPLTTGTINVDRTSDNCRQGTAIVGDPSFDPVFINSPLSPYGCELHIKSGLVYESGLVEWVPLGVFTLDDVECEDSTGDLPEITFYDRSKNIQRANFRNVDSWGGHMVKNLIHGFINGAVPGVNIIYDPSLPTTPIYLAGGTTFDTGDGSRWSAIKTLCSMMGAEGRFGPDGNFYVLPVPTIPDSPTDADVLWTFDAGENGVLTQAKRGVTRIAVYNCVVVTGATTTNGVTPTGVAWDSDPRSPTYYGVTALSGDTTPSPFGPNVLNISNDQLTSDFNCQKYAQQQLNNSLGLARSLAFTAVPFYGLDGGDLVKAVYRNGLYEYHLLDAFSLPLGVDGQFTGTTRTLTYQLTGGT